MQLPILIASAVVTTLIVAAAFMSRTAPRTISDVSTTSIAAYDLYAKGLDANRNARWAEAVTWLKQATAIDPAFAEAHLRLASAYEGVGQIAARDRSLSSASAHAAKLSERIVSYSPLHSRPTRAAIRTAARSCSTSCSLVFQMSRRHTPLHTRCTIRSPGCSRTSRSC